MKAAARYGAAAWSSRWHPFEHHREIVGLTQSELAEKLGLDSLTISRLETGVQMPTIERLNDTAVVLQVSLPILVTDAGQTDIFGERVAAAVQDLPPSEKEFVHTFAVQFAQHWRTQAKRKTNT